MAKDSPKSGSKKGSPDKKSKDSPKKSKGSPDKKKSPKDETPQEEEAIVITLPTGVMHKKVRQIYDEELKSDINFVVGAEGETKTFKLHRCLLVSESPIFQKLVKDLEDYKIECVKKTDNEEWEKIKQGRPLPPDIEDEDSDLEDKPQNVSPDRKSKKGSKKESPSKKGSPKKESPKGKSKGSPDKAASKAGSSGKDKKGSPDKKSGKSSKKDSPKKKGSPDKSVVADGVKQEEINLLIDLVVDENTIRIQDVHPDGFYRLMRYIYYDEIVFNGVIGTIRTLYAARKYLFYDLGRACVLYLEHNLSLKHVLRLLKASLDFHEDRLEELCMDMIRNQTFEVINQAAFIHITKFMLNLILEQDILNIREIELFDQVAHWAENRCEDLGIPVTSPNQRIALGPYTMSLIRFPTILPHEFAVHILENGILRSDELIGIMSYHITGHKPNVPYSFVTRRRPYKEPLPESIAYSIIHSNVTDITFVDISSDKRIRYATSMDDLDKSYKTHDMYDPCKEGWKPKKTVKEVSDYPLYIQRRTYKTTSLPDRLDANNYELQLIHYKLHADSCRILPKNASYIDNKFKDLTVLQSAYPRRMVNHHWETQLNIFI